MATIYTDAGEALTADLHVSGAGAAPANWYIGWGTGTGTAAKGDTTLFTESSESRVTPTTEDQPTADQNRWIGTITADGTKTVTNAGMFAALTAGAMLIKGDFTGIAMTSGDKIEFTITLTWS